MFTFHPLIPSAAELSPPSPLPSPFPSSSFPLPQPNSNISYPANSDPDNDFWLSLLSDHNRHQGYQPRRSSSYPHTSVVPYSAPLLPPPQYRPVVPEPKKRDWTTNAGQSSVKNGTSGTSFTSSSSQFVANEDFTINKRARDVPCAEEAAVSLSPPCANLLPATFSEPDLCNKNGKRPRTLPPRPPNAFILYRKDMSSKFLQSKTGKFVRNGEISKVIGEMWKNESEPVRTQYYSKAAEAKRVHAEKYPEYKYRPARSVVTGGGGRSDGKHRVVESEASPRGNESPLAKVSTEPIPNGSASYPPHSVFPVLEYDTDPIGRKAHAARAPNHARCFRTQLADTVVDEVQRCRPFSGNSGTIGTSFEQRRESAFSNTARTVNARLVHELRRPNDYFPADVDTPERSVSASARSEYESPSYKRFAHAVEVPVGWHAMDHTLKQGNSSTLSDTASLIAARLIQSHPEIQTVLAEAYLAKYLEQHRLVPPFVDPISILPTPEPERRDNVRRGSALSPTYRPHCIVHPNAKNRP